MFSAGPVEGQDLKNKADAEIDRILDEQYERGMQLLVDNRDILDAIANTLIEKEKIDGNQMLALIKDIKPELISEEAVAKVKEMVKPITDIVQPEGGDGPDLAPAMSAETTEL